MFIIYSLVLLFFILMSIRTQVPVVPRHHTFAGNKTDSFSLQEITGQKLCHLTWNVLNREKNGSIRFKQKDVLNSCKTNSCSTSNLQVHTKLVWLKWYWIWIVCSYLMVKTTGRGGRVDGFAGVVLHHICALMSKKTNKNID